MIGEERVSVILTLFEEPNDLLSDFLDYVDVTGWVGLVELDETLVSFFHANPASIMTMIILHLIFVTFHALSNWLGLLFEHVCTRIVFLKLLPDVASFFVIDAYRDRVVFNVEYPC